MVNLGMAEWRTSRGCSGVIRILCDAAWPMSSSFPKMRPRVASEKKGGRKKASMAEPELVPQLKKLVEDHTAGSAIEPGRVWTSRSAETFSEELAELGFSVCANTVNRLLRGELGLSRRKMESNPMTSLRYAQSTKRPFAEH